MLTFRVDDGAVPKESVVLSDVTGHPPQRTIEVDVMGWTKIDGFLGGRDGVLMGRGGIDGVLYRNGISMRPHGFKAGFDREAGPCDHRLAERRLAVALNRAGAAAPRSMTGYEASKVYPVAFVESDGRVHLMTEQDLYVVVVGGGR